MCVFDRDVCVCVHLMPFHRQIKQSFIHIFRVCSALCKGNRRMEKEKWNDNNNSREKNTLKFNESCFDFSSGSCIVHFVIHYLIHRFIGPRQSKRSNFDLNKYLIQEYNHDDVDCKTATATPTAQQLFSSNSKPNGSFTYRLLLWHIWLAIVRWMRVWSCIHSARGKKMFFSHSHMHILFT